MRIVGIKIADWALAERRQKMHAEWRDRFFTHVRGIFVLLSIATVAVVIFNHQVEIRRIASTKLNQAMKKPAAVSDILRTNALNYEKEVNEINQPPQKQP